MAVDILRASPMGLWGTGDFLAAPAFPRGVPTGCCLGVGISTMGIPARIIYFAASMARAMVNEIRWNLQEQSYGNIKSE